MQGMGLENMAGANKALLLSLKTKKKIGILDEFTFQMFIGMQIFLAV